MTEKISAEQRYITAVMKRLPDAEKGKTHTMEDGDNLWNIAKRELNKKNAKNSEISDYMFLIAKLNNLDTIEKMNSLKVLDKIYLPKNFKAAESNNSSAPPKVWTAPSTNAVSKVQPGALNKSAEISREFTDAEISILKIKKAILEDKNVKIEKMYKGYPASNDLYHVYNQYKHKSGYVSTKHPLMSFVKDRKSGEIKTVSFDDQIKDKYYGRYDYEMKEDGTILTGNFIKKFKAGKVDKNELEELHSILKEKADGSVNTSF